MQKEQFSDGVGYGWIDGLKAHAATAVTDLELRAAVHRFPLNTPGTKEAYLYRSIFEEHFPQESATRTVPNAGGASIACSTRRALDWHASFRAAADPSGRAVAGVHVAAYRSPHAAASGDIEPVTVTVTRIDGIGTP